MCGTFLLLQGDAVFVRQLIGMLRADYWQTLRPAEGGTTNFSHTSCWHFSPLSGQVMMKKTSHLQSFQCHTEPPNVDSVASFTTVILLNYYVFQKSSVMTVVDYLVINYSATLVWKTASVFSYSYMSPCWKCNSSVNISVASSKFYRLHCEVYTNAPKLGVLQFQTWLGNQSGTSE